MTATQHSARIDAGTGTAVHEPRPAPDRIAWDGLPRHTPVSDLMTRQVVTVGPRTDYATLVAAVREHHHDLLPVVDAEGRVMGLVAASDLLAKLALTALPPRGIRFETRQVRALRRKGAGVVAGELMTAPAWTVTAGTSAADAARVALRHRIHHLPVTDDQHRLVGMVCLCDLLGAVRRDDAEIRSEVLYLAVATDSGTDRATLRVDCDHGRILLDARTARRSQAATLLDRVRAVEGVVDVADTLRWDIDDLL
ncbi:CBS domain-containing protein [Streptacidiphilus sp. N1-12]|uniref:CBS domain-containing protein n=2 Tax=Streptacidiphilus alkalitolerans TaxID=3342712 RepID=A0ABV6VHR2_9ACTN